jgi:signal transduction histidine kinase
VTTASGAPRARLRLPRHTIRLRLTVLFGALFLLAGAALLTVTYLLVRAQYTANNASFFVTSGRVGGAEISGNAIVARSGNGVSISVHGTGPALSSSKPPSVPTPGQIIAAAKQQSTAALHGLLINSGFALAIMALLSIWLGWVVAGRALQPLRTITNAARNISASNLHRRLALGGPDDELKQLGNTFDALLARLETSFEAQRQFVANASHELRTPLTLERTLVEVALADPDPSIDSLRRTCEQVLGASEHQERLIEALLTLSRSQRGLDQQERIDLAATTVSALRLVAPTELTLTNELAPAWTRGDPRLLERLVANLLENAIRYNVPGGSIELSTGTDAEHPFLRITNTGPLIPEEELDRLYLPFERLENTRADETRGLGLGLSIVQAIAVAHDAALSTETRAEGGLRIEVRFPPDVV